MGIIELSGLRLRRGRGLVLDDWNLTVESGEVVVLSGENGCGKSTLIEAAAGLLPLEAGSSTISGQLTFASGATVNIINTSFSDDDTSLMTSQAIKEKIEAYSYSTTTTKRSISGFQLQYSGGRG